MTTVYESLAAVSVWWWPRFADHLWQATLFALVTIAASLVLKRGPAQWRYTFCLLASAKFIIPAALFVFLLQQTGLQFLLPAAQPAEQNASLLVGVAYPLASTYESTVAASAATLSENIYVAMTAVWLAGTCLVLLFWAVRRRTFVLSLRLGRSLQAGREWEALKRAQEFLGLKRTVQLLVSPLKIEPGVWRVWSPIVVIPESMATLLDEEELEAIMLHEMIHVQRRDNLIGHLQLAICALLWFHPLVWIISRRLFDEREQVCDQRVLELCEAPGAYASSILKVVRFCVGWRVAGVIGAASGSNLRRRIENIMSTGNTKRSAGRGSRLLAATLVSLALLILVAAGVKNYPLTASATAQVKAASVEGSNDQASVAAAETDKKSSKKARPTPPPAPPAESGVTVAPADSPQPPQPAEPAQPAVPDEQEIQDSDKPEKDKSWKEQKQKVNKGELIEAPRPDYPEEIKKQKIDGMVVVVITIGHDGNVIYAKAKSGPEELYGVSEAAALKARFKPTILDGNPVKVSGVMTYNFVLDKK